MEGTRRDSSAERRQPIELRPMERSDIAFGMKLKALAGWNQIEEDWELFLKHRPRGCLVAGWKGSPAGTVATIDYGGVGWIALLLVAPEFRRRGIGTALLEGAIEDLAATETTKLDATPEGKQVYDQRGFVEEYGLARWRHPGFGAASLPGGSEATRPMRRADLERVIAFDSGVFGRPRRAVLEAWIARSPQYAFLSEGPRGLDGFCMGRNGSDCEHIGPVVAADGGIARALLLAALRETSGRPVYVDSFRHTADWLDGLVSLGFRKQRDFIRMYRGPNRFPGEPRMQWAAAGPELG